MNKYPLWKYLLIITIIVIGAVYALPNLYPSDPSVQITASEEAPIDEALMEKVQQALVKNGLTPKEIDIEEEKLLVRFTDTDTQLSAADHIKEAINHRQYVVALNLAPATPTWLRGLGAEPMYLGLDLRGGVHFLMEVDEQAVIDKNLNPYIRDFKDQLRGKSIRYTSVKRKGETLQAHFKDEATTNQALNVFRTAYIQQLDIEKVSANEIHARMNQNTMTTIKRFAIKQNIVTLRKRVNELGVAEPIIQQQGLNRIVVQLPGVQDTARAKIILGATATLEFRMVDEQNSSFQAKSTGQIPSGSKLYTERNGNPILLKRKVILHGDRIIDAQSGFDEYGKPSVTITLDSKGSKQFSTETRKHVKDLMAVVFIETKINPQRTESGEITTEKVTTEEVINVARIQEELSKRFNITGLDSSQEARNLALLLRAGALAAPVYIVEERTVGPSLGQENIDNGFKSVVMGFILVLIFMAIYYKVFGLVANIALALNLVLIISVLSIMQATLTLPGIAGIVLTVGMAVDANVLIFERIKEEIRNGVTSQAAIKSGYEKALSTIADANVTTLIAAVVLFSFGTGPIKGFAITLAIGIVSSMFTAIMGTRAVINLIYGGKKVNKLSI